jgi:sodium/bile acid cotransporter 7
LLCKKNLDIYKDHTIIGYCTISYRSGKLAEKLGKKGIKMLNLKGGMLAWVHEGGKVYDDQHGETKRVHVYKKK